MLASFTGKNLLLGMTSEAWAPLSVQSLCLDPGDFGSDADFVLLADTVEVKRRVGKRALRLNTAVIFSRKLQKRANLRLFCIGTDAALLLAAIFSQGGLVLLFNSCYRDAILARFLLCFAFFPIVLSASILLAQILALFPEPATGWDIFVQALKWPLSLLPISATVTAVVFLMILSMVRLTSTIHNEIFEAIAPTNPKMLDPDAKTLIELVSSFSELGAHSSTRYLILCSGFSLAMMLSMASTTFAFSSMSRFGIALTLTVDVSLALLVHYISYSLGSGRFNKLSVDGRDSPLERLKSELSLGTGHRNLFFVGLLIIINTLLCVQMEASFSSKITEGALLDKKIYKKHTARAMAFAGLILLTVLGAAAYLQVFAEAVPSMVSRYIVERPLAQQLVRQ